MATSLAATAAGLLICYLLWKVRSVEGKTMNAVFLEKLTSGVPFGGAFVVVSLIAEGLLLVVAAQAGFIDGPRVLANMAIDSWVPRRFGALSDRLTTGNGILLMGAASLAALWYTKGDVRQLVVMYSINVFLTFSLSIFGMLRKYWRDKRADPRWGKSIALFAGGFTMCVTILAITIVEKFGDGGWVTLAITGALVLLCFYIKSHYLTVAKKLAHLQVAIDSETVTGNPQTVVDPKGRTAVVLVGGYGGLGIQTVQSILKTFPGIYRNFVFVSIGVVDSGAFKGEGAVETLKTETEQMLKRYVALGMRLGVASTYRYGIGTDVVQEAAELCEDTAKEFAAVTFFTGKIIFEQERWYQRLLHNETGLSLQKRLQLAGHTMVVLPAKVA